jgi:hypothetical protein
MLVSHAIDSIYQREPLPLGALCIVAADDHVGVCCTGHTHIHTHTYKHSTPPLISNTMCVVDRRDRLLRSTRSLASTASRSTLVSSIAQHISTSSLAPTTTSCSTAPLDIRQGFGQQRMQNVEQRCWHVRRLSCIIDIDSGLRQCFKLCSITRCSIW